MSSLVQAEIYHSRSLRESPEKIYASEEWYSESPPHKSISPATGKKINEGIEALSSHSSDPECNDWDPTGKTPEEIVAWREDCERGPGQRSEMAKRRRQGVDSTLFYLRAQCYD